VTEAATTPTPRGDRTKTLQPVYVVLECTSPFLRKQVMSAPDPKRTSGGQFCCDAPRRLAFELNACPSGRCVERSFQSLELSIQIKQAPTRDPIVSDWQKAEDRQAKSYDCH
jgi:hypothetical protein